MFFPIIDGQPSAVCVGKCVCVGRNYAAHAQELNNPIPQTPILFLKPADAVVGLNPEFSVPTDRGEVHHELEIAILLGKKLTNATEQECREAIAGVGLALDLTLRDVQARLKENGHPWELAKAFDGACPVGEFISVAHDFDFTNIPLSLLINNQLRQQGNSASMLFPILPLISHISRSFTLNPGDLVLTGTPVGVGPLKVGDELQLQMADSYQQCGRVVAK